MEISLAKNCKDAESKNYIGYENGDCHISKIQLRISNTILSKKKQYQRCLAANNIKEGNPYVLAIGLYDLPLPKTNMLLSLPTAYLGVFFPVGHPLVYFSEDGDKDPLERSSNLSQNPANVTYQQYNKKLSLSDDVITEESISKEIFFNEENSWLSAVLLSNRCDAHIREPLLGEGLFNDLVLIHNPFAKNPLPKDLLPVLTEHVAYINESQVIIETYSPQIGLLEVV